MMITEFLLKRIAEDEYLARTCLLPENLVPYGDARIPAIDPSEWGNLARNYLGGEMGEHCAQQNPTKTLAECAAKRAIIREHAEFVVAIEGLSAALPGNLNQDPDAYWRTSPLRHLASVYKEHPDYQPEWALDTP